jgi:hypothetical protein
LEEEHGGFVDYGEEAEVTGVLAGGFEDECDLLTDSVKI